MSARSQLLLLLVTVRWDDFRFRHWKCFPPHEIKTELMWSCLSRTAEGWLSQSRAETCFSCSPVFLAWLRRDDPKVERKLGNISQHLLEAWSAISASHLRKMATFIFILLSFIPPPIGKKKKKKRTSYSLLIPMGEFRHRQIKSVLRYIA